MANITIKHFKKVRIFTFALALTVSEILTFQIFLPGKRRSRLSSTIYAGDAMRWRIPASIKVLARIYTRDVTVSEILTFKMFGPIRLRISTSLKVQIEHFSLALIVFQILVFQILCP